jgi:alpha-L-fucosidase
MRCQRDRFPYARLAGLGLLGLIALSGSARAGDLDDPPAPKSATPLDSRDASRRRFEAARFGLAVRWGVHALLGKGESVMERDRLPVSEYEKLPPLFNPAGFDPEAWVKAAQAAGMKYLTVTAKGPDGFCLFDSKLTRYDVVDASPYGKDPLKALADACRKHDLPLFVTYSLLDWHHPDYFPRGQTGKSAGREERGDWSRYVAYYQGQVRELCTGYGPIGGIWFEGTWDRPDADWDLAATYALIRTLQPAALVANLRRNTPAGEDAQTFERDLPMENTAGVSPAAPDPARVREVDQPLGEASADDLIRLLVNTAAWGANLRLSLVPKPDGTLPPLAVDRLEKVGKWLATHGASVYGTRAGLIPPQPWGVSTLREGAGEPTTVYLHVFKPDGEIRLPEAALSLEARVLGSTRPIPLRQDGKQVLFTLDEADRSPVDTVIVLTSQVLAPATERRTRPR